MTSYPHSGAYGVPDTIPRPLHFTYTTPNSHDSPGGNLYCHLHFAFEETEAQEGSITYPRPYNSEGHRRGLQPGGLKPESLSSLSHYTPGEDRLARSSHILRGWALPGARESVATRLMTQTLKCSWEGHHRQKPGPDLRLDLRFPSAPYSSHC